ncbi:hypothetical protein Cyrtocomes_01134 [Candidatus Cyrtobacter comes]|uniref:Uncharacterized protein n=2 Tax=Candidatus Cyrtobacter comes TaxID=675776 RepID=A0ABU5L9Y6_9RICK|nr:hypothetical protein [Candidatus Cyrtobacter comes]
MLGAISDGLEPLTPEEEGGVIAAIRRIVYGAYRALINRGNSHQDALGRINSVSNGRSEDIAELNDVNEAVNNPGFVARIIGRANFVWGKVRDFIVKTISSVLATNELGNQTGREADSATLGNQTGREADSATLGNQTGREADSAILGDQTGRHC